MKSYFIPLVLLLTVVTSCSTTDTTSEEELFESTALVNMTTPEEELFNLVNEHRISIGLQALAFSSEAYKYAEEHNVYMITEDKLSHDHFSSRASKLASETNAVLVGENVAKDFTTNMATLNGWLNSPAHKSTIEGDFTHSAVSITINGNGKPFFTQLFYRK